MSNPKIAILQLTAASLAMLSENGIAASASATIKAVKGTKVNIEMGGLVVVSDLSGEVPNIGQQIIFDATGKASFEVKPLQKPRSASGSPSYQESGNSQRAIF